MSALDIVARGLAARALDSGSVTSIDGATNRTAAAKLASDVPLSLLDFYETGEPDMTNAVTRLSAAFSQTPSMISAKRGSRPSASRSAQLLGFGPLILTTPAMSNRR